MTFSQARHAVGLAARQDDLAGVVVHPFEQDLDLVAGLGAAPRPRPTR